MNDQITIYQCSNVGISGTTPVHVMKQDDGTFEARCGFALMGMTMMSEDDFAACDHNPFHPDFSDNYARGKGKSEPEALQSLKLNMQGTADSLWA